MTGERLDALEFKVAHLERALQELSDVLYQQQLELDAMRTLNQQLIEQLQRQEGASAAGSSDEIPPHY